MIKWEYLLGAISNHTDADKGYVFLSTIVNDETRKTLNELGQDGWELVTIARDIAYFKRPLQPEVSEEMVHLMRQSIGGYFGGKVG